MNIKEPSIKDLRDIKKFPGDEFDTLAFITHRVAVDDEGKLLFDSLEDVDLGYEECFDIAAKVGEMMEAYAAKKLDPLAGPSSDTPKNAASASNRPKRPRSKK